MNYKTVIEIDGTKVPTLADILPEKGPIKMLIIAKTPVGKSVEAGHYFQGSQGKAFWNRLQEYGLLNVPHGKYEDETLLDHNYGLTDIVKVPHEFDSEPSATKYRENMRRVQELIKTLEPQVLLFVYKKVLDNILKFAYGRREKSKYGYNPDLNPIFNSKVFTFPSNPCKTADAQKAMVDLTRELNV